MAVYPLHVEAQSLVPQNSFYSDEHAAKMCSWYLTDHPVKDEHGCVQQTYRLHSCKHRSFADFMQYDVECPKCHQRLRPIQNALNSHDLALYTCTKCNKK